MVNVVDTNNIDIIPKFVSNLAHRECYKNYVRSLRSYDFRSLFNIIEYSRLLSFSQTFSSSDSRSLLIHDSFRFLLDSTRKSSGLAAHETSRSDQHFSLRQPADVLNHDGRCVGGNSTLLKDRVDPRVVWVIIHRLRALGCNTYERAIRIYICRASNTCCRRRVVPRRYEWSSTGLSVNIARKKEWKGRARLRLATRKKPSVRAGGAERRRRSFAFDAE